MAILFSQNLSKPIRQITRGLNQFAEGNFIFDVDRRMLNRKDEIGDSGRAMDALVTNFTNLIVEVKTTSNGIYAGATQVSASAQSLSQTSDDEFILILDIDKVLSQIKLVREFADSTPLQAAARIEE